MTHLLCFGLGFSATKLAADLASCGWTISATATTPDGAARIAALGYRAHLYDGTTRPHDLVEAIGAATHAVVSAPPGPNGDPVLAQLRESIAGSPTLGVVAYLSTIGVYGDHRGAWIDETAPLNARSARSVRRVEAEAAWSELAQGAGKTAIAFRIAGIYGPGRSALDTVSEGTARRLIKPGQVFNRIHRDDIASMVAAAMMGRPSYAAYNVCDDEPAPPQDVIAYAAELLGMPVPPDVPFETADVSEMTASFYSENKRTSNARAKADLGWRPKYPTYREGLGAIAAENRGSDPTNT